MIDRWCGRVSWPARQLSIPGNFVLVTPSCTGTVAQPYTLQPFSYILQHFLLLTFSLLTVYYNLIITYNPPQHDDDISSHDASITRPITSPCFLGFRADRSAFNKTFRNSSQFFINLLLSTNSTIRHLARIVNIRTLDGRVEIRHLRVLRTCWGHRSRPTNREPR